MHIGLPDTMVQKHLHIKNGIWWMAICEKSKSQHICNGLTDYAEI